MECQSKKCFNLSGKDLDEYGESLGIPRYHGLGFPETDEEYRKSISRYFNQASDHVDESNKIVSIGYAVVWISNKENSNVSGVCCSDERYHVFRNKKDASNELKKWLPSSATTTLNGKYAVREVNIVIGEEDL